MTQAGSGTVAIAGGGATVTYAPLPGYCNNRPGAGVDTFTYTLAGGSTATVSVTGASFDATLTAGELSGTWRQGGAELPLTLRR